MPIQKLVLQVTVLCDTDTLEEATHAFGNMSLAEIQDSITDGDDIGSGVKIVEAETLTTRLRVESELHAIGNDGSFFDVNMDDEDSIYGQTADDAKEPAEEPTLGRRDIDIQAEADTLDRIDVVYNVKMEVCINAGTYSGPLDSEGIAALVQSRGIHGDDITEATIIEVTLDDKVIARAA